MALPSGITAHLIERGEEALPFVPVLLQRWMEREFEPRACRAVLEELLRDPSSGAREELLRPEAIVAGEVVATEVLLFPRASWSLRLVGHGSVPWMRGVRFD